MSKKKEEKQTEKRMYVLVAYNLGEVHKGIQAAHAMQEYGRDNHYDDKYKDWVNNWKTMIVLNGGTTNSNSGRIGSLQMHILNLRKLNVTHNVFVEPDLNDAETAVAFVLDMVEDSHVIGYLKQMGLA